MTAKVKVAVAVAAAAAAAFPIGVAIGHMLETRATGLSLWVGSVLAGVWLLASGWRGRRVGDEPRCAKCGYILLHLESGHCPECGTEVSMGNTVTGEHQRGWGRLIAGVLLLMAASSLMIRPVGRAVWAVPWYQYRPAGLVVDDVDGLGSLHKAMVELQRRESVGELPERARRKLVGKALEEQAPATLAPRRELLDYVLKALVAGHLTKEEKERFLEQACDVTMAVRPVVGEGERIPLEISLDCRGPSTFPPELSLLYDEKGRRIDGKPVDPSPTIGSAYIPGLSRIPTSMPAQEIGKHTVELDVSLELLHIARKGVGKTQSLGKRSTTVRGSYQVVSRNEAPQVELLDSESLRAQVVAALKIDRVFKRKDSYVAVAFRVAAAPSDLAFNVFVQSDKGEMPIGAIHCTKGQSRGLLAAGELGEVVPAKVNVVLRPSVEVAKQTVDVIAIYSEEIVFPDVVVR